MDLHSIKKAGWTEVKPTFCLVRCASALEDDLQGILNLAVTQVARVWRVAETRSSLQLSSGHDAVHDLPARGYEVQIRVAISGGTAIAEHRMIEQVEELKPELQFDPLPRSRDAPVLVKCEVHISDVRAMALSSLGLWRLAENITVHGEGIGVDIPQIVSAKAGLSRHHQRANAEMILGGVAIHPPRIFPNCAE